MGTPVAIGAFSFKSDAHSLFSESTTSRCRPVSARSVSSSLSVCCAACKPPNWIINGICSSTSSVTSIALKSSASSNRSSSSFISKLSGFGEPVVVVVVATGDLAGDFGDFEAFGDLEVFFGVLGDFEEDFASSLFSRLTRRRGDRLSRSLSAFSAMRCRHVLSLRTRSLFAHHRDTARPQRLLQRGYAFHQLTQFRSKHHHQVLHSAPFFKGQCPSTCSIPILTEHVLDVFHGTFQLLDVHQMQSEIEGQPNSEHVITSELGANLP